MRNTGIVINEMCVEKKNKSLGAVEEELKHYLDLNLFNRKEMRYCYQYKIKENIIDEHLDSFLKEQLENQMIKEQNIKKDMKIHYLQKTYLCKDNQIYIEGYVFCRMNLLNNDYRYLMNLIQKSSTNPLSKAIYFD